jgi:twinkle protein
MSSRNDKFLPAKKQSKDDIISYISNIYNDGYDKGLSTGISSLDPHFTMRKRELTIITGLANRGKSTFLFYLMLLMSKKYGWKWGVYSPENSPVGDIIIEMSEMYNGMSADKESRIRMSKGRLNKAVDFITEHFFFIEFNDVPTAVDVVSEFNRLCISKKLDGCVVDPWNDLKKPDDVIMYDFIYQSLAMIRRFKVKHNLHFIISTHSISAKSRAVSDDGTTRPPSMYDAEGGGVWANRSDNFITIHRNPNSDDWDKTQVHVRKVKFQKLVGVPTPDERPVILCYSKSICRFKAFDTKTMTYYDPLEDTTPEDNKLIDDNMW